MDKYNKSILILIAVAIGRLLFLTEISLGAIIIFAAWMMVALFITAMVVFNTFDNIVSDEGQWSIIITMTLVWIVMFISFLNATEITCSGIEKVHTEAGSRPEHVDDNTYYNLTCDKGTYYVDDDRSIQTDGKYGMFDGIHENKVANKTTNYDKAKAESENK